MFVWWRSNLWHICFTTKHRWLQVSALHDRTPGVIGWLWNHGWWIKAIIQKQIAFIDSGTVTVQRGVVVAAGERVGTRLNPHCHVSNLAYLYQQDQTWSLLPNPLCPAMRGLYFVQHNHCIIMKSNMLMDLIGLLIETVSPALSFWGVCVISADSRQGNGEATSNVRRGPGRFRLTLPQSSRTH